MSTQIVLVVKTLTGSEYEITINEFGTIRTLRDIISQKEEVEPDQVRLVHKYNELYDYPTDHDLYPNTLESYDIKNNDKIHIVLRLNGC